MPWQCWRPTLKMEASSGSSDICISMMGAGVWASCPGDRDTPTPFAISIARPRPQKSPRAGVHPSPASLDEPERIIKNFGGVSVNYVGPLCALGCCWLRLFSLCRGREGIRWGGRIADFRCTCKLNWASRRKRTLKAEIRSESLQ